MEQNSKYAIVNLGEQNISVQKFDKYLLHTLHISLWNAMPDHFSTNNYSF